MKIKFDTHHKGSNDLSEHLHVYRNDGIMNIIDCSDKDENITKGEIKLYTLNTEWPFQCSIRTWKGY